MTDAIIAGTVLCWSITILITLVYRTGKDHGRLAVGREAIEKNLTKKGRKLA
jgi:hypothetical protein